jgi:uncharacterized protein YfkK (UPF0435 family)
MKKKSSLLKILSISFPILCIIVIIVGLFWMGTTKQQSFASINGFEKFKLTLIKVLDNAQSTAKTDKQDIIVCAIGSDNNSCGTENDWVHGFIIYKGLKTDTKNIPDDQIVKIYSLNIVNTIVTEHDRLDMKPNGALADTYHFIIKSKNENLFPYEITVQTNSKLIVKLLDSSN